MMRRSVFLFAVLTLATLPAFTQPATDSTFLRHDSVRLSPSRQYQAIAAMGNYISVPQDTIGRQLFNGLNVSNIFRGHMPNLSLDASLGASVSGFRNVSPMFVIDGAPYSNSIGSYYNLNTFNFETVAGVSSGNALALYGGLGSGGAVILESKSGKGIDHAQFEANSTTAFTWTDETDTELVSLEGIEQWIFSNAIAYAQDFGTADMRVSYTNTYLPDDSRDGETVAGGHALKINSGFEFSPRFAARIIADGLYAVNRYDESSIGKTDEENLGLTANVFLNYKAADWLTLTSQSNFIKTNSEYGATYSDGLNSKRDTENDQHRALTNVMATFHPRISDNAVITFSTGMQLDRQLGEQESWYTGGYSSQHTKRGLKVKTRTWVNQVDLQLWKHLSINVNYRYDYLKDERDNINDQPTYSVNTAFNFKDALAIGKWLTGGTLRGSYGKTNAIEMVGYPYVERRDFGIRYRPNPDLEPTQRKSTEVGADLYFLNSRLSVQSTYFRNRDNQTLFSIPLPSTPDGTEYVMADIGSSYAKGFEAIVGYDILRQRSSVVSAKVIYAGYKFRIDPRDEAFADMTDLNPGVPDWTGSLLMQFRTNHFFGHLLTTHQSGGEFTLFDRWNQSLGDVDLTQTWLRDIAFGYQFSHVSLSVSGRNLWEISSKMDDHEVYDGFVQKAVTLSATFRF